MNTSHLKQIFLKLFILFLIFTALIAIVCVISGKFGKTEQKIIATTAIISASSICSMACAGFINRHQLKWLGFSGICLTVFTAALFILGLWAEINGKNYWRPSLSLMVISLLLTHAFLLYIPRLGKNHQWIQLASGITLGILAILILIPIWAEKSFDVLYVRLLSIVSIIAVLETLLIPIFYKLNKAEIPSPPEIEKLVLRKEKNDIYIDEEGRRYEVKCLTK